MSFDHCLLVENSDDGVFTVDTWHDRNAQIDIAPLRTYAETTILRNSSFPDIEISKHLEAGDDLFC
ncbi:hypothetical protein DO71_6025 [Burkholderia pseudomallei]|nr:hypothetical protein DO71_6025 [Burkholderia pseudomallei]